MTMELDRKEIKYILNPGFFGGRNGLEDKILYAMSGYGLIVNLPLAFMVYSCGLTEGATKMGIDKTEVSCALVASSLVAYTFNKIQTTGLTVWGYDYDCDR